MAMVASARAQASCFRHRNGVVLWMPTAQKAQVAEYTSYHIRSNVRSAIQQSSGATLPWKARMGLYIPPRTTMQHTLCHRGYATILQVRFQFYCCMNIHKASIKVYMSPRAGVGRMLEALGLSQTTSFSLKSKE